jgi:hypothetical protein
VASIHRAAERNCPKSLGRPYNVALRDTEMVLFGPFWRSYTGQIYGRNPAPTPFRTVSEEVFSEAGIQLGESLCVKTGAKGRCAPL